MANISEKADVIAESLNNKSAELLIKAGARIVDATLSCKEARSKKLAVLSNKLYDKSWQYNETILRHYVKRKIYMYNSDRETSIKKIRQEIAHPKQARNIILTGSGGTGKSTTLKWLYLNTNVKGYAFTYLPAKAFSEYSNFDNALDAIEDFIDHAGSSVVFIDGLDEFACISGVEADFNKLVAFIDRKSCDQQSSVHHKFVISTRPEHFGFQKMIIRKNAHMNLDNYCLYELRPLTPKETLKICESVKHLSKLDLERNYYHFRDKWPEKGNKTSKLTEGQYRKALREYLKKIDVNYSLLTYPLLCRYAYQIVSDWRENGTDAYNLTMQSERILRALKSYIKWEFHDTDKMQTGGGEGREAFDKYFNAVFAFLTNIAGEMGDENAIEKQKWHKIWKKYHINKNAAFCALQEFDKNGKNYYAFFHQSFYEFFLARYYALGDKQKGKFDENSLKNLLTNNVSFAVMYVEQIYKAGDKVVVKICDSIAQQRKLSGTDFFMYLSNLASGRYSLTYYDDAPFTVEEYLTVFIFGRITFAGTIIDKDCFLEIRNSGVFEITDPHFLTTYSASMLSDRIEITGIRLRSQGRTTRYLTCNFWCLINGKEIQIGGYHTISTSEEEIRYFLNRSKIINLLSDKKEIFSLISENEIARLLLAEKELEDAKKVSEDFSLVSNWGLQIASFLGIEKQYWCLYDGVVMHVYAYLPSHEKTMNELFKKGMERNPLDFSALYGEYCTYTQGECILAENVSFDRLSKMNIVFTSSLVPTKIESALIDYYTAHWKNANLYKRRETSKITHTPEIYDVFSFCQLFQLYEHAGSILRSNPNNRLTLYLSDEKLITYFLLNDLDTVKEIAESTIDLCDEFGHSMGKKLREQFIECESIAEPTYIKEFILNYLWIPS